MRKRYTTTKLSTVFLLLFILSVPGFAGEELAKSQVSSNTIYLTEPPKQYVDKQRTSLEIIEDIEKQLLTLRDGQVQRGLTFNSGNTKILEIKGDGTIIWYKKGVSKPIIIVTEKHLALAFVDVIRQYKESCK